MEKLDTAQTGDGKTTSIPDDGQMEQKPALSKNQIKKQLRLQKWAETKKDRRKQERQKVKERKRRELEERKKQGLDDTLPVNKKRKMSDPEASNIRVAIDCAYDNYMTESDIKKLLKQIQRCYAENRKSAKPLQFYISSLRDQTKQIADTLVHGYQNWDVHLKAESPDVAFGAENIVYLAAESPNVLQNLDPEKVYIIGGLVDHNHHKGICYQKITEKGWSHAQLPIGDFVKLNSRKVLAVNHVFEIILAYIQLGSWRDAFYQILPSRKVKTFLPADDPSQGNTCSQEPIPSKTDPSRSISESSKASLLDSADRDLSRDDPSQDATCSETTVLPRTCDSAEEVAGHNSCVSIPEDNGRSGAPSLPQTASKDDQTLISEGMSCSQITVSQISLDSHDQDAVRDSEQRVHEEEESASTVKDTGTIREQERDEASSQILEER